MATKKTTEIQDEEEQKPIMVTLRRRVYALESRNEHMKRGKKDDAAMVSEIIRTIQQTIDEREG